ncbi:MAG: trifunctional transcriptional regulator/proline dehydrogenase/L-glutamate gamma-semialdehyde dehydrogenase [Symbiopectobacterium sp.]|uniref:trifunctional transcriptional regulator/proline dehydrogenase/L-glutamate gamma-semialdehyde dehydrogenase n=1 Tax=Symbiopectobacterium sp. TaxID=2952789 RepID=UPI0039EBAE65
MGFSTIAVKLDDATRDRIKRTALRLDRTSHWLIEHAIFCYLDAVERDGKAPDITPAHGVVFNRAPEIMPQSRQEGSYQPFLEFTDTLLPRSPLRDAITAAYRRSEREMVPLLLERVEPMAPMAPAVQKLAYRLAQTLRLEQQTHGRAGRVQSLLQAFSLSSSEGIALMCLAEALLRIPDASTRDAMIRDKISSGDWHSHLGKGRSLFVNAATWGLLLTGKLVATHSETRLAHTLKQLINKGGEPVIRLGMDRVMRLMGEQFVTGETIDEALSNAQHLEQQGFRYSYDMLGEAALTAQDAEAYLKAYQQAIHAIGKASAGRGVYEGPGISIKLSALHPRYSRAQYDRVMEELYPRLLALTLQAMQYDIGINIDAEEAERLEISLDLLERLCNEPSLAGWKGIGFVVQAYQKRCPFVINFLIDLAQRTQRRLMVRLVKGAYWDSEIKRTQMDGLEDYPVYTRKVYTDVSYLACARQLLAAPDAIYPQFATHNAHTLSAVYTLAGENYYPGQYEFQCLHGMGEALYTQVVGPEDEGKLARPCRIYAPVGTHETLLAYLVRRLLENGANTSFVNRIADADVPLEQLIASPIGEVQALAYKEGAPGCPHPRIPLPAELYGTERCNAQGVDLTDERGLEILASALRADAARVWHTAPIMVDVPSPKAARPVTNPAQQQDVVGYVRDASEEDVRIALGRAVQAAERFTATLLPERAACLQRAASLLEEAYPQFIGLLVREAGKTVPNAIAEIREAVDFLRYYAQQSVAVISEHACPLGVVVCISPWNFPLAIFTGQVAAALAAGNAVLAKPAEQTPLVAALAVQLLHQAGIAPDVLQLLPGTGESVGAALVEDARVNGVLFTGSTAVAKRLQRTLAGRLDAHGRPAVLIAETGGMNAMIVDSSALTEQVVSDVMASAFDSAGQRCSALRLLCLQNEIADATLSMLRGAMAQYRVGNPDRLVTDCGPLIDDDAREQIEQHVHMMRANGHPVFQAAYGVQAYVTAWRQGTFVLPTLIELDNVTLLQREVFGPVLHVVRYAREELDTLIEQINALGYGLTLGVHSRIDETISRITQRAHVGNQYVNRNMVGAVVGVQPFGGEGLSGTGPKAGGPLYLPRLQVALPGASSAASNALGVDASLATTPERAAFAMLIDWAQRQARSVLLAAAQRYRAWGAVSGVIRPLPGPTGERNTYMLTPRDNVLCLAQESDDILLQLAALLAVGCSALWPESEALRSLARGLPQEVQNRIRFTPEWQQEGESIDAVICHGDSEMLRQVSYQLAQSEGAIVPLLGCESGSDNIPLERLWHERVLSVNTAAAGGNASLLMMTE